MGTPVEPSTPPPEPSTSPPSSSAKIYPPSPLLRHRMAELRQSATCQDALFSLNQIVKEMQPSAVPRFLTHLQSETSSPPRKPSYAHHAISLYISLAREHKEKLVPQIPRVMRNLMLHLKTPGVVAGTGGSPGGGGESSVHQACAQVVLELARIPVNGEAAGTQLLQDICSPLIGALSKGENGPLYGASTELFGAAYCLKALVDCSDVWQRASDGLVDDVCSETAEVLRTEGAAVFLQLACSLARSNIAVCQHYADDLLQAAGQALQWHAASWQQRFAAAKLYTEVLSRADSDVVAPLGPSALKVLESVRDSDPSPYVREQAVDAIRALKGRSFLRDSQPSFRGPKTPDASPPRRTPKASPPRRTPPASPPLTGALAPARPTPSAESPKLPPKRSKFADVAAGDVSSSERPKKRAPPVLASVEWPSGEGGGPFGGSPIYELPEEDDASPLLTARRVPPAATSPRDPPQGLQTLTEDGAAADWRRNAKLMQSAEWPAGGLGSPVYEPEDFDLTPLGVADVTGGAPGAFRPAAQLGRTPLKKSPLSAPSGGPEPATPETTPVFVIARTPPLVARSLEGANSSGVSTAGEVPQSSPPPERGSLSPRTLGPELGLANLLTDNFSGGEVLQSDPPHAGGSPLSPRSPGPELGLANLLSDDTDAGQALPDVVLSVSKIPRPPSTRRDSGDSSDGPESSPPHAEAEAPAPLTVNVQGEPPSPSSPAHQPRPENSPSRIPTPSTIPRPKASVIAGSHIPPAPAQGLSPRPEKQLQGEALSKPTSPGGLQGLSSRPEKQLQREALSRPRSPSAELERGAKKRAPGVLLKRESFEERLRQVADRRESGGLGALERPRRASAAGLEEIGAGRGKEKGNGNTRRKSSIGPADFLATSPRQMIRRLTSESPASAKTSPSTTPKSVLTFNTPGARLPGSTLAPESSAYTPPETPGAEAGTENRLDGETGQSESGGNEPSVDGDAGAKDGVNGDGGNALEMDKEIDEDLVSMESPGTGSDTWAKEGGVSGAGDVLVTSSRRESANGGGAAGRYSFGEDSGSDTEAPKGTREDTEGRGHVEDAQPLIAFGSGVLEEGSGETSLGEGHVERSGPQVVGARFAKLLDQANTEAANETGKKVQEGIKAEAFESERSKAEPPTIPSGASPSKASRDEDLHRKEDEQSPAAHSGGSPDRNEEWRVHENPIAAPDAGRASLSPGWEASETTFDKETLRRMSAGEVSSPAPPEGLGVWVRGDREEGLGLEARLSEGSEEREATVPEGRIGEVSDEGVGVWGDARGSGKEVLCLEARLREGSEEREASVPGGRSGEVSEEGLEICANVGANREEGFENFEGLEASLSEGSKQHETSASEETRDEVSEEQEGLESEEKGGSGRGEEKASGVRVVEAKEGLENEAGLEEPKGAQSWSGPAAEVSDSESPERSGVPNDADRDGSPEAAEGSGARDIRNEESKERTAEGEEKRNTEMEGGIEEESEAGAPQADEENRGAKEEAVGEVPAKLVRGEFYQVQDGSAVGRGPEDKPALEGGREREEEADSKNQTSRSGTEVVGETSDVTTEGESPNGQPSTVSSDVRTADCVNKSAEEKSKDAPRVESREEEKSTSASSEMMGASPPKVKKRVTFSEHNQYQMIEPNPPPEERALMRSDAPERLRLRDWVRFAGRAAEKGVRNTVIAIAAAEVGTVMWVVTRGLWEAYCAPTINVPLPS
ncbi:hypothetical protein KFL_002480060 [Klebsormidium nitens]|uniref:TORTIFOLIA1/SINE1-2 N-terminal domain-containing protein n=1 Tax=Klebsormidium nitens TaxID=105231 RepID=A0A1Y1IC54_KLENI|nr:hypothetical protein KFL_002480060 [Klebsormidium nitens]|eukprot:GAQ85668.1 hypothetical protein KFL_002480060 [Klebsormidium nitens]